MSDLTIHGDPRSSYVRTVRMAAEEKGVPYTIAEVVPGTDEIRALHPWGKMPVMDHGNVRLFESNAICHYIDAAFDGPSLVPSEPARMAEMEQWISATVDYAYNTLVRDFLFSYVFPKTDDGSPDLAKIEEVLPEVARQLAIFDTALEGRKFLCGGDSPSIADLFIAPIFFYIGTTPNGDELFGACPNIRAAAPNITGRACYIDTMPPTPEQAAAE